MAGHPSCARTLTSPWHYLDLARFCLSQGREAEALRRAQEGLWLFEDGPPDERLVTFAADLALRSGQNAEAEALLWRAFERQPSLGLYQHLRPHGGEAGRDRAIAVLRTRLATSPPQSRWVFPADLLIQVLMVAGMFTEAWDVVRAHGASDKVQDSLALASHASHPREALAVYAARVDQLVTAGGNPSYEEACRLVARMAGLREASEQATYVAQLKVRFKPKRNFMKLLGS